MDSHDFGRLLYLALLGCAVAGCFLVANRMQWGKVAREATVWALIFVGVVAAYGLWSDIRDDVAPRQSFLAGEGRIAVPRSPDGHYYLTLRIDDTPVRFVVDTGATDMVLSQADARRVGIDTKGIAYLGRAETANGTVTTAGVTLGEVRLGDVTDRNFRARVNGGEMDGSLLGMTYLQRFDSLEIRDGRLILTR